MCVSPSNILSIYAKQIQELTLGLLLQTMMTMMMMMMMMMMITLGLLLQTNVKGELVVAGAAGEASQVPVEQHRDQILGKS